MLLQRIKKNRNPRHYAQEWNRLMLLVRIDLIPGKSSDYRGAIDVVTYLDVREV
jgi:hypothetical protein